MERLTKRLPSGAADYNYHKSCYIGDGSGADRISQSAFRQRCVERLADYEDTKLTPGEVKSMQEEHFSGLEMAKLHSALMELKNIKKPIRPVGWWCVRARWGTRYSECLPEKS